MSRPGRHQPGLALRTPEAHTMNQRLANWFGHSVHERAVKLPTGRSYARVAPGPARVAGSTSRCSGSRWHCSPSGW
jgi:hypothetical protein